MKKISTYLNSAFSQVESTTKEKLFKAARAGMVQSLWANLVEEIICEHTNAVYIFEEEGVRKLCIYVDESIFAVELKNRADLIKLACEQNFGEIIDEVHVYISYGLMKKRYPFKTETCLLPDQNPPQPLDKEEIATVERLCEKIPEGPLREKMKKAMTADLEWKKGNPRQKTLV